ncbi:MAG: succinate dehydrogenase, hydrophobic membrane anchor protein [Xanthomonadaceae bacterium]|jgi:succinate dehydrogenase / fumarate reductase membrane anchor subunit|nr:succinate dehydrogenase, hydrophobic membrane anchor protein [Xanthomonadaceae bacterium]
MNDFQTPLKKARGWGAARTGTEHFVIQRFTATALVFLGLWFLYFVINLIGLDYLAAKEMVSKPWNAMLLVIFLISIFWHAQLGIQVVLEDYIHGSLMALVVQTAVRFIAVIGAVISVFAVVRIALGV